MPLVVESKSVLLYSTVTPTVTMGFAPVAILRKPSRSLLIHIIDVRGMLSPLVCRGQAPVSQVSTLWSPRIRSGDEERQRRLVKFAPTGSLGTQKLVGPNGGEYFLLDQTRFWPFGLAGRRKSFTSSSADRSHRNSKLCFKRSSRE